MNKILSLIKGQIASFLCSGEKDPQTWVFSSLENKAFNYNSKYLFLYVKENIKHIKPLYVINDENERKRLQSIYGEEYFVETETLEGMKTVLNAGVWFTSAGMPVYAVGTGKNHVIVNLWHGIPLKKIALMEEHVSKLQKLYFKKIFSENYKYILTTSERLVPIMAKSFAVSKEKIKVWGQPRNDLLLDANMHKKVLSDFVNVPEYEKAILYAPTYRDNSNTRWFPFEDFDAAHFQNFLAEHKILLCLRAHAEEKVADELCFCPNIVNVSADVIDDITGYLYLFDMLITDYSSIYIDYMLLNRPMMFLPYDKQEYLSTRGMNFDYDDVTPGKKPETYAEFLDDIQKELKQDTLKEVRMECNQIFNQIQQPCCDKICEKILELRRQM